MADTIKLIISSPPEFLEGASRTGLDMAPMIYRAGSDMHLYRTDAPVRINGGIMYVDSVGFSGSGPCTALASEIISECLASKYRGIMLDFTENTSPMLPILAEHIHSAAMKNGISLYVPPWLHRRAPGASVVINTFVSSGSLAGRLKNAVAAYGRQKTAADVQCTRAQFSPPYGQSSGRHLTIEEFKRLSAANNGKAFFSPELCAYYFNLKYNGKTTFVIYDNAISVRRKLALLKSFGIETAFLFYPEVSGFLRDII